MSPIRKKIAEHLLAARQQTAMLTTFNEADMKRLLHLRTSHKENFAKKHGVKLGLMSFFVKASIEALKEFETVNARIDGEDIVYQDFYDIGIAVGGKRGLVVPILRDADGLSFAGIEKQIGDFGERANRGKLALEEIQGGTFTISNGGVYGSLLSTPILNPPQSAVLGMHAIQERPVVINGEIQIRPMMNLALSYDHRIIDGREAVSFLKRIKTLLEDPEEMLLEM
jgi:2-oxoglutarate dehydrogenase E2 component (dihydrolipoamide succinyltransferase)